MKPKKKKEVTEAQRAHLANIRVKALKVKSEEEEIVEQVIIKKKSNNNKLTNNEKVQLAEQSAEERLRQSLKEDRLNCSHFNSNSQEFYNFYN